MKIRSQACEDAKQEYMEQLRKTNEAQRQHYEQRLPHVFKQLQVRVKWFYCGILVSVWSCSCSVAFIYN